MSERFEPPLVVVIVGRPRSPDWTHDSETVKWSFFDELFRSLCYDIGNPRAANPAIPVYFSTGDFDADDVAPPPQIDIPRAQRTIVFVLLDSGFRRATDLWGRFFDEMRSGAGDSGKDLRFIPVSRADDGNLGRDLERLGLGSVAPISLYADSERSQQSDLRFLRVSAKIAAIQALRPGDSIDLFVSYARRDAEGIGQRLRRAATRYPHLVTTIDSMAFRAGARVDTHLLEQKLETSSCVIIFQTNSYADRHWCRREALLAQRRDIPIVVVETFSDLQRTGWLGLATCPQLRMRDGSDGNFDEILELAVSETLRILHHRLRSVSLLSFAGIDPDRVEILVRTPEPIRLLDLSARNAKARGRKRLPKPAPKHLILYPDPPLTEIELAVLRMVDPKFHFVTPSTILIDSITRATT